MDTLLISTYSLYNTKQAVQPKLAALHKTQAVEKRCLVSTRLIQL